MEILASIPFRPDFDDFARRVRLHAMPAQEEQARRLAAEAAGVLRPKALVRPAFIGARAGENLEIDGVRFRSRVLSANLAEVERVFPYVATCGTELDSAALAGDDLLALYWLDVLKEMALERAVQFLHAHLARTWRVERLSSMNPGSGEADLWPLPQQRPLFALFGDVRGAIGVTLHESLLMSPNKSVSGILFPTDVPFESCQLCTREGCPRRRAPYQGLAH